MKRTERLDLILQFLEDIGDKRYDNINMEILDKWASSHNHDGENSELIDLDSIWSAIEELRRLIQQLRVDHTNLDIRELLHYGEYQRHKHYELNAPPSVETHWFDTFNNLLQTDTNLTNVAVSTAIGTLHMPANYKGNTPYYYVSKPFRLQHTLQPGSDVDVQPQQAKAEIFMTRQGRVTPYIAIANGLTPSANQPKKYPFAVAGKNIEISAVDNYVKSKFSFENKIKGNPSVPHRAYHHIDKERPSVGVTAIGTPSQLGKPLSYAPKLSYRTEFSTDDYQRIARSDGAITTTQPLFKGSQPVTHKVPASVKPEVLFHDDVALAWNKRNNRFYWFKAQDNDFDIIPNADIKPLVEENMVGVAAGVDESDNSIYVLKTWVVRIDKPAGYFDIYHQIVRWNRRDSFREGKVWKSGRCKRKHWLPNIICPTHLHVSAGKINIFTHMSYDGHELDEEVIVNYYDDNQFQNFDAYMWFPWGKVYGNLHKKRKTVTFAKFNPGILATHHSCSKGGEMRPVGPSKIISGAYSPNDNSWVSLTDENINAFEGGNDNVFLGVEGTEAFYYQGFVPYNGAEVLSKNLWKNEAWKKSNPDVAWYGIIAHNFSTGTNRFIRGDMPFKINAAAIIDNDASNALFMGGTELVKQFITTDDRIIATENNNRPQNTEIKYAFWADRFVPQSITPDRLDENVHEVSPSRINISTGKHIRLQSSNGSITIGGKPHKGKGIRIGKGMVSIGGIHIQNNVIRPRPHHPPNNHNVVWEGALNTGDMARQMFWFELGEGLTDDDIVKVYVKANSEGKRPLNSAQANPWNDDIKLLNFAGSGEWQGLGRISNGDGVNVFTVNNIETALRSNLIIMLENTRISDSKAKIASKIHTDFIYVTVERQGYIYKYEWEDLPFNGNTAAVVLECTTGTLTTTNPGVVIPVGAANDIEGVRIESAEFSIISNKEG